jgi:DNA polymerase I-like protein with 3'-5' exonuclease and polymerase domains
MSLEEFSETYNHKVASIKKIGYDDVYNINVEKTHNYATAAGVIIKNCYHKDPTMMKYLQDPHSDMHGDMAAQIFCIDDFDKKKHPEHKYLRNATKNSFVFPQFYGDYYANNAQGFCNSWLHLPLGRWKPGTGPDMPGGIKLSDHMISKGIRSYQDFEDHMKKIEKDFWGRRFYVYQKWKDTWVEAYQKKGFFDMYTGFRCSGIMRKNEVINYPVQGAAFHCLLWSFIQLDKILVGNYRSRLIGQIHDAVILDVHPDELEEIAYIIKKVTCRDLPEAWKWIIVPLDVEADLCPVDGSWNMKESYKLPQV